jgi:ribose transport system permease protein
MASLAGAMSVVLMSMHGVGVAPAIALSLVVAVVVGLVNGFLVAVLNLSSFITTLAMGSILTGIEFKFTDQHTIVDNIPSGFLNLGSPKTGGLIGPFFLLLVVCVLGGLVLSASRVGRNMYAIGANPEAARLAGVPVRWMRVGGFVIAAVLAAVAGIVITAVAGSSFPNAASSQLLPAFAAAFLGSVLFPSRRFSVVAAVLAAFLLQMVSTGLVQAAYPFWTTYIFNGVVLVAAMLTALNLREIRR